MGENNIIGLGSTHRETYWGIGMKRTRPVIVLFISALFVSALLFPFVSADESVEMSLSMKDNQPRLLSGISILVAGFWHRINVSLSDVSVIEPVYLVLHSGENPPMKKNTSTYYEWSFDRSNGFQGASDLSYITTYIDEKECIATENHLEFCIGIKDTFPNTVFYNEIWALELHHGDDLLIEEQIRVEKPTNGFAKIHGDRIECSIDPFKEMSVEAGDYIMLKNTGNVPLTISLDYSTLDSYVRFETTDELLSPQSTGSYRIMFDSESWQPQFLSATGTATASVPTDLMILEGADTSSSVYLQSSLVLDIPLLQVFVGHNSYQLEMMDLSSLSYQYKTSVSIPEGSTEELHVYISGNGEASLSISPRGQNITLSRIRLNDQETSSPLSVVSTDTKELIITFTVKALSEGHHDYIDYSLETDDEIKSFSTKIHVIPPQINHDDSLSRSSNMIIFVLLALVLAGGYIVVSFLRHRRQG